MSGHWAMVVSSEHASRQYPEAFAGAVSEEVYETHAAWDPGAKEVAMAVSAATGAPVFLGQYTRLFVDLNRSPGSPEAVPARAFGVEVPPNGRLTSEERAARIAAHHAPYWRSVREAITSAMATGRPVLHLSVHSFVEVFDGRHRPVDLGVLIDPASRLEKHVGDCFMPILREAGFDTRENEPYDGRSDALTTALRAELPATHYAGVEIEINQRWLGALDRVARAIEAAVRATLGRAP